jgi:hypothetical protein
MILKRFNDNFEYWGAITPSLDNSFIISKKKRNKWWKWLLLFIAIISLAFLFLIKINYYYNSHEYIFKRYYAIENVMPATRGESNIKAIIKFQQKDFDDASVLFKQIWEKDSSNYACLFYYGISNMEKNNYEESIKSFKYIIDNKDNNYIEQSKWYLALCYIKCEQNEKAIKTLEDITKEECNYYREDADNILRKIKK